MTISILQQIGHDEICAWIVCIFQPEVYFLLWVILISSEFVFKYIHGWISPKTWHVSIAMHCFSSRTHPSTLLSGQVSFLIKHCVYSLKVLKDNTCTETRIVGKHLDKTWNPLSCCYMHSEGHRLSTECQG